MTSFCTIVYAPSKLEEAMNMLLGVFEKYAVKHGDRLQLSGSEMRNLFREELQELMKEASNRPQKFGEILSSLDKNLDGQVNFEEFVSMATKLIMCTSSYFDKYGGDLMCGYE
ncbi:protein S100-A1-like isoform X2 [Sebastes umbrosus]|uniref:protein S100-A1-like isoform X2 n=1 Tax=Sebastes umbrosus TaxID=72105 RepID=UPI00189DA552|nr:protein S100-A1-like isoform X2 [Sebastes umbrosus]